MNTYVESNRHTVSSRGEPTSPRAIARGVTVAARTSLLAIVAAASLVGCGGSTGAVESRPSDLGGEGALDAGAALVAPFTCGADPIQGEPRPASVVLEQLRVAASLDVLEERAVVDGASGEAGRGPDPERAGTPCASATDRATCAASFAALSTGGEVLRPPFDERDFSATVRGYAVRGYFLAYSRGDTVGKVSTPAELRALFPSVDTPAKALLYANAAGYRVECHTASGWIHEETDGWTILASRGHERRCSRADVVLWLRRDGALVEERYVVEDRDDPCT